MGTSIENRVKEIITEQLGVDEKEVTLTNSYLVQPQDKPSVNDMILSGTTTATEPFEAGARNIAEITEEYSLEGGKVLEGWSIWQK